MQHKRFKRPTDIRQWWQAPHCGPGSTNASKPCGFCGLPADQCARLYSAWVARHPEQPGDGSEVCAVHDAPADTPCGGSGLWCSGCGRFWAQDSCGEAFPDLLSADGAELFRAKRRVACVCGWQLFTLRPASCDRCSFLGGVVGDDA